jgi:hypothetical protein
MNLTQKHQVADDYQAFDVMAVAMGYDGFDRTVEGIYASRALIPSGI